MDEVEDESVDCIVTDPPYGMSFMCKEWDKALPDIKIWQECLRVLKPGAFAFVMCIPRQDCLSRMIISLEDAGFMVNFTPIYWAYASGFPKAQNIGKAVDKRLGVEREVVGNYRVGGNALTPTKIKGGTYVTGSPNSPSGELDITAPATPQAKALDGSYAGFQPKPAVEVIIVAMKPLSEKTFVDQALKNGKGISWLDDCRIPYESEGDKYNYPNGGQGKHANPMDWDKPANRIIPQSSVPSGRFPANLLVSDDVLNDGRVSQATDRTKYMGKRYGNGGTTFQSIIPQGQGYADSGSFSRYFDLDKWAQKTFPFLIVPKASKGEKNRGCEGLEAKSIANPHYEGLPDLRMDHKQNRIPNRNNHPTVKPLKLMSYLITLGSREGDTILDPFMGSGTTCIAAKMLNRECIGYEIEKDYCEIATKRCSQVAVKLPGS